MKNDKLACATIVGLLVIAIASGALEAAAVAGCGNKASMIDFGCREFWLNRYQTTVQTLLSTTVGAVGLYFVLKQLDALGQQNEMTRAALEANTQAHRATQLTVIGKAVSAINKHAAAAGTLSLETVAIMDGTLGTKRKPDPTFYADVAASIPDVYPVLTDKSLVDQWKALKAELDVLQPYILLQSIDLVRGKVQETAEQRMNNPPKDMLDAFGRCLKLNQDFLAFAKRIDV
jgi:hypothetical protein